MKPCRISILSILFLLFVFVAWGEEQIVPTAILQSGEFKLAGRFLQKYGEYLKQPQTETVADIIRRTKEDGFEYIHGNDNVYRALTGTEDFLISFNDGLYNVAWNRNGINLITCSFPANIGLLTFSNKIDLENDMIKSLLSLKEVEIERPAAKIEDLKPVPLSNFYINEGDYYLTPRLKNQIIYDAPVSEQSELSLMLIDSLRYQLETISNFMLTGYTPEPLVFDVKIDKYGYTSQNIEVNFLSMFKLFESEGCKPYWGIETFDGIEVKGLYIWENRAGGFNHVMTVIIPVSAISKPAKAIATLHSYIRTDNLKSLFEDYMGL